VQYTRRPHSYLSSQEYYAGNIIRYTDVHAGTG
jgi:hypothetical protein